MKHDQLRNVAHNLADSLACGCFIIGYADINMAAEAKANPDGKIGVDFRTGDIIGRGSPELCNVMAAFADAFPDFCVKNGVSAADYAELTATFSVYFRGLASEIRIVDRMGRCTIDRYVGIPLKRPKILDHLGRLRPLAGRQVKQI